jgi:hypothetical protein
LDKARRNGGTEDVEVETEVRLRSEGGPKIWQEVELLIRTMVENKPSPRKNLSVFYLQDAETHLRV